MATTIDIENAKPIRQAMSVEVSMQTSESVEISGYAISANKMYDAGFLRVDVGMRTLADLQDDGFPLNGAHALYEPLPMNEQNGKIGIRGLVGTNLMVQITATSRIASLTIKSENVLDITYSGETIPATGLDVIYVNSSFARIYFTPKDENSRIFIDYIEPGVGIFLTNNDIIRCGVNLRSNLSPDNPSWEASDIEIQAYYPHDISDSLAHVQDEWPIIYRAGYPGDMSPDRKFYLSEPAVLEDNVLTLRGVDATPKLEAYILKEGDFKNDNDNSIGEFHAWLFVYDIEKHLRAAGIDVSMDIRYIGELSSDYYVLPEMTLRDCVQGVTNLTADLKNGVRVSYVDAGRPLLKNHDYTTPRWYINEEDLAEVQRIVPRKIREVRCVNSSHKFDETLTRPFYPIIVNQEAVEGDSIVEYTFDSLCQYSYVLLQNQSGSGWIVDYLHDYISWTPSGCVFKPSRSYDYASLSIYYFKITGGVDYYRSTDGLPGVVLEMEPFVIGKCGENPTYSTSVKENLFSPQNLLRRNTRTTSFLCKGDPRWQPRDFLTIRMLDGSTRKTRIASIEIEHEGGGTQARVTCQDTNLY